MLEKVLEQAGMEPKQAKIYLAALSLGETSVKEIASKSGVKRTTIYDVIQEMIDAGYIRTVAKGAKKRFLAATPEELQFIVKRRLNAVQGVLGDLLQISNVEKGKPKVWFFEGTEGLKKAFADTLKHPESEILQWASQDLLHILGEEWSERYMSKRAERRIFAKTLAPETEAIKRYRGLDEKHYREIRLVDPENIIFEIELDIYGDRVAMISGKDQVAVIIESRPVANTLKAIHRMCWNSVRQEKVLIV